MSDEIRSSKRREKPMYIRDWSGKFDGFLKFNVQNILQNVGKVAHEVAVALAEKEHENFRVGQDKRFESDFDRVVKKYLSENAKSEKQ